MLKLFLDLHKQKTNCLWADVLNLPNCSQAFDVVGVFYLYLNKEDRLKSDRIVSVVRVNGYIIMGVFSKKAIGNKFWRTTKGEYALLHI